MNNLLTFEQQESLVARKLATKKEHEGLVTFKYAHKVMYDYLWDSEPMLLECRGHTYDAETKQLVSAAPRKTFNYMENKTWANKPMNTKVNLFKKYNGFMACLSIHKGEIVVSTTGTTNSDYAILAKKMIFKELGNSVDSGKSKILTWPEGCTWLWEICHSSDPHIVDDLNGAKYLGCRDHKTGIFTPVSWYGSDTHYNLSLAEALQKAQSCKHEGYMMYDKSTDEVCKLKSPYYVHKKKLMRASASKVEMMYENPAKFSSDFPTAWALTVNLIVWGVDKSVWLAYTDQQRRAVIEQLYKD